MNNILYALRILKKHRGFSAVAVTVLTLAIGANTALFSLVNAYLLRPLMGERAGHLVQCYSRDTQRPDAYRYFSYPEYQDLRQNASAFSELMAYTLKTVGLARGEMARRVCAFFVSANYFSTLGVRMAQGRAFTAEEERPGSQIPVVVVSYAYWSKTGADPGLVGSTLRVNGQSVTVIGITPQGFNGTMVVFGPEIWLPLGMLDTLTESAAGGDQAKLICRDHHCLALVGQLKPNSTLEQAGTELQLLAGRLAQAFPAENRDQTFVVFPLPRLTISPVPEHGGFGRKFVLRTIVPSLAAAGLTVLLIACLNLANMLLARATARRKEIAIRLALGAGRLSILRQLVIEGLVLSLAGGAAGLVLAVWGTQWLASSMGVSSPFAIVYDATPDGRVLAAAAGFCLLSTLFFSLGPAWKLSRPSVVAELRTQAGEAGRHGGSAMFSLRNLLVTVQIALSLMMVTVAGLFIRGSLQAARVNPGFSLEHQLLVEVDADLARYDAARGRELYRVLTERLQALPGIAAVSPAATVPLTTLSEGREVQRGGVTSPTTAAADSPAAGAAFWSYHNVVGSDYFKTLGVSLVRGREFNSSETRSSTTARVAIIDELLARRLWPGEEALGRSVQFAAQTAGEPPQMMQVVGIVPTLRNRAIESRPTPNLYTPFGQDYRGDCHFHLRTRPQGPEAEIALLQDIRREIRKVDDRLPILTLRTLQDHMKANPDVWLMRTAARVFAALGALALLLAALGVYGVKAYLVARRTREIGIRMALGATTRDVLSLILRDGIGLALAGVAVGLLLSAGAGFLVRSMLYQTRTMDPITFGLAPLLLISASLLACYLPGRRAARVSPTVALRCE